MNIIVCLDECNTMAFNNRRQSMDAQLRQHMLKIVCEDRLWMHPYSEKQFSNTTGILFDPEYMEKAAQNDWCFVEIQSLATYIDKIGKMLIYRWNRRYPGDLAFPEELLHRTAVPVKSGEFKGSSHECINWEMYEL